MFKLFNIIPKYLYLGIGLIVLLFTRQSVADSEQSGFKNVLSRASDLWATPKAYADIQSSYTSSYGDGGGWDGTGSYGSTGSYGPSTGSYQSGYGPSTGSYQSSYQSGYQSGYTSGYGCGGDGGGSGNDSGDGCGDGPCSS